jgi:glycerol-3-phosphate dehydrogenase (NAD(P)+)
MGDLVLTCMGDASRNRRVGLALGQGKTMAEIMGEMKMVAEGVKTAKVAHELAAKLGVDAPIIDAMHGALHAGVAMRETINRLLSRVPKAERD